MRRIIGPSIAALIATAGLILSGLMGYLPNMLPNLFQDRPWLFWGSIGLLFILLIGYAMCQAQQPRQSSEAAPSIDSEQAKRNRRDMIANVRATWIAGVLDRSVAKDARIALGLEARPDAVIHPVDLVVQRPKLPPQPLPAGIAIRDIYDQLGRALLILGAPGAGKTTLLLELTRDLLDRATDDPQHPIPVVFPLSTWAAQRRPLHEWLCNELVQRYQVPLKLAQSWIDADAILPLLDGLDEVAEPHRNACADAINAYRQTRGHLPLVVASRIGDYEALTTRLNLHGAIVAQPLSRDQVRTYLRTVRVAAIPSSTSPLWELLDTPLMLTVAALAYAGQPLDTLPADPVAARDRLFAVYIDRMLQRNAAHSPFTDAQTRHYLAFLAHQMQQHEQTVFYLENLQPNWLPLRQRWWPGLGICLVVSIVFGLISALQVGIIGTIIGSLVVGAAVFSKKIEAVEILSWSSTRVKSKLRHNLIFGIGFGGLFGCVVGLGLGLSAGPEVGLGTGLGVGLSVASITMLFNSLTDGLTVAELDERSTPNQGIERSYKNAEKAAKFGALTCGCLGGAVGYLAGAWMSSTTGILGLEFSGGLVGAVVGTVAGMVGFWLRYGGVAYFQHYLLRLLLIRNGSIPRRLVPFLDYVTQRIFLRRVGGGYIFIHRLLLEHFAAQYTAPGAAPQPAAPDREP